MAFRRFSVLAILAIIVGNILLLAFSPDLLSAVVIGTMLIIICIGTFIGLLRIISFADGFRQATGNLRTEFDVPAESIWTAVISMESVFDHKVLDHLFEEYKDKLRTQQETGQILSEIEEYINEDSVTIRTWNNVLQQIPGSLTGLGLLGTFTGLIVGISRIGFSSSEAVLESVETLLAGIHIAFYTSIAGIILSISFNILHKTLWNVMTRQMELFVDEFHKKVIPTVEEQERYREQLHREYVLEKLDRIPRAAGTIAGVTREMPDSGMNERLLMPQIMQGLEEGEFGLELEARHDIFTGQVVGAEAVIVWDHSKIGRIPESVFLPIVRGNGYISRINGYIWEQTFGILARWKRQGSYVPISINVSRADLLSGRDNADDRIISLAESAGVQPRMVDVEIDFDALENAEEAALRCAEHLTARGFRVILDHFDGNFVLINTLMELPFDEIKLDLSEVDTNQSYELIVDTYEQASARMLTVSASSVRTMEQISLLRKSGCRVAQGTYFSGMMRPDDFIEGLRTRASGKEG